MHPRYLQSIAARRAGLRDFVCDAGISNPCRRREYRNACPTSHASSPSIRYATRDDRRPREDHLGSFGLARFHKTKSSGSCLASSTSTRAPARKSSSLRPDNCHSHRTLRPSNSRRHAGHVGIAFVDECLRDLDNLGNEFSCARLYVRRKQTKTAIVFRMASMNRAVNAVNGSLFAFARSMILSSMSVMLRTKRT